MKNKNKITNHDTVCSGAWRVTKIRRGAGAAKLWKNKSKYRRAYRGSFLSVASPCQCSSCISTHVHIIFSYSCSEFSLWGFAQSITTEMSPSIASLSYTRRTRWEKKQRSKNKVKRSVDSWKKHLLSFLVTVIPNMYVFFKSFSLTFSLSLVLIISSCLNPRYRGYIGNLWRWQSFFSVSLSRSSFYFIFI